MRVDDARDRDPAARELLDDHRVGREVEAHAAVLLGDRDAEQPELGHLLDDRRRVLVRAVVVLGVREDLLVDELADHLGDRLLLVGLLVERLGGYGHGRGHLVLSKGATRIPARDRSSPRRTRPIRGVRRGPPSRLPPAPATAGLPPASGCDGAPRQRGPFAFNRSGVEGRRPLSRIWSDHPIDDVRPVRPADRGHRPARARAADRRAARAAQGAAAGGRRPAAGPDRGQWHAGGGAPSRARAGRRAGREPQRAAGGARGAGPHGRDRDARQAPHRASRRARGRWRSRAPRRRRRCASCSATRSRCGGSSSRSPRRWRPSAPRSSRSGRSSRRSSSCARASSARRAWSSTTLRSTSRSRALPRTRSSSSSWGRWARRCGRAASCPSARRGRRAPRSATTRRSWRRRAGDAAAARTAMRSHLDNVEQLIRSTVSE